MGEDIKKNLDVIKCGDPYPDERVLKHCRPIVKVIDGWKGQPVAADKWDGKELPKQLQTLFGLVEHHTGGKVISFGNGANTEEVVYIRKATE